VFKYAGIKERFRMESAAAEERVYAFREVRTCVMCGGSAFRPLGRRLDRSQGARPRRKTGLSVSVQRCQTCGLIFPQPLPVPQTLAQHYDLPADEYWSAERVAGAGPTFASEVSTTLELLGRTDSSGLTALDIGAGFGATLRALGEAGFDAVGVEPSPAFRRTAIEQLGVESERIVLASIEDEASLQALHPLIPEGGFDLISFGAVLEHLVDPGSALLRALEWLAPDGVLHIEVPSARWLMSRLFNLYFTLRGTDFVTHLSPMHSPYHLYEFTLDSFARHGKTHGYEIVRHSRMVGDTFVPWPLDPFAKGLMRATGTGLQLTVWLRKS
jgi:SAM-dependent methyltransferase